MEQELTGVHSSPSRREKPSSGLWNRSYIVLLLTGTCTAIASYMTTPIISKYIVSLGYALPVAGGIASIMSIAALIARPFSGVLSDRYNRKAILFFSTVLTGITMGLCGVVGNVYLLAVVRTIHGLAFSFMTVANMALASSLLPSAKIGEGMGYLGLSTIIASAAGPGLGLFLSDRFGYLPCFFIAMCFLLVGALATLTIPYHQDSSDTKVKRRFSISNLYAKELTLYMLLLALFSCGNGLVSTYLAIIGEERGVANIALFFTVYALVVLMTRPFAGRLLDRRGLSVILYPSFAIASFAMVLVGAASTLWIFLLAAVLKAIGQGAGSPSIQAYSIKLLGKERAGVASSTCYIGQDIGNGIAPIIGGFAASALGYDKMFYGYAGLLLVLGTALYTIQCMMERNAKGLWLRKERCDSNET